METNTGADEGPAGVDHDDDGLAEGYVHIGDTVLVDDCENLSGDGEGSHADECIG